jgi:hypothetical protein
MCIIDICPPSFKLFHTSVNFLLVVVRNQNSIYEESESRLNSGNACCHSVQSLLFSHLLSKNFQIKIHKTLISLIVSYWCKIWSLTLREEHSLRLFENRLLRGIFGPKREEVAGGWRRLHEGLHNLYTSPSIIRVIK